jgi:hypothetical protein
LPSNRLRSASKILRSHCEPAADKNRLHTRLLFQASRKCAIRPLAAVIAIDIMNLVARETAALTVSRGDGRNLAFCEPFAKALAVTKRAIFCSFAAC